MEGSVRGDGWTFDDAISELLVDEVEIARQCFLNAPLGTKDEATASLVGAIQRLRLDTPGGFCRRTLNVSAMIHPCCRPYGDEAQSGYSVRSEGWRDSQDRTGAIRPFLTGN